MQFITKKLLALVACSIGTPLLAQSVIIERSEQEWTSVHLLVDPGSYGFQIEEAINNCTCLTGDSVQIEEGAILAGTYKLRSLENRAALVERLVDDGKAVLSAKWRSAQTELPLKNSYELLILASILEREATPEFYSMIAGVYLNKLRKNMSLGAGSTTKYAITRGRYLLDRNLLYSELTDKSSYDTFRQKGLPPTPISSPSRETLDSVSNAEASDFFFFVPDGNGGFLYASTLSQNTQNMRTWKKNLQAKE